MATAPVTTVLVHCPLLGPASLRPLADAVAALGHPVVLLDLVPSVAAAPVHQRMIGAFADAASDAAPPGQLALVGHGAAGTLLPAFAAELEDAVTDLVYLDADLPTPGRSWRQDAPAERYAHLRDLSREGLLPRYLDTDPLAGVVDDELRAEIAEDSPELPIAFLKEQRPTATWSGPSGYVALSADHYRDLAAADTLGWPVRALDLHHLGCATDPAPVADAVLRVLLALRAG